MSSEIDLLTDPAVGDYAIWALKTGLWDGRPITWKEAPEFLTEVQARLYHLLFSQDPDSVDFKKIAVSFAWIGSQGQARMELLKEIEELGLSPNGAVVPVKHKHKHKHDKKEEKSFWEKHKVAILVGLAAAAVITTIVVVAVCTGGTGSQVAATVGGAAVKGLQDALETKEKKSTPEPVLPPQPAPIPAEAKEKLLDSFLSPSIDNYASKACKESYTKDFCSPPPFQEIQLLGSPDQSTIHFHCGINNNISTVLEGGTCLSHQLKEEFAIQPHLVHSEGLVKGLALVGLEKWDKHAGLIPRLALGLSAELAGPILQHSDIQRSVDYEIEHLSRVAEDILEKNNPRLKQVHVTFSNGGYVFNEALKQLPPEHRETIVVITAGTTEIIEDGLAHEVYNVIGDKDWPSKFCNGGEKGIEKAKDQANIDIITQTETNGILGGHYFTQPDYQQTIQNILETEIVKKYEVY